MFRRRLLLVLLVLLGCGSAIVSARGQDHPSGSPSADSDLMKQAKADLASGDFQAARSEFAQILMADPENPSANDGLFFADLKLNKFIAAKHQLEHFLANQAVPNQFEAIDGAANYVHDRAPMRAIKLLTDYLKASKTVDEPALNALAICVAGVDSKTRKTSDYEQAVRFYQSENDLLEATHPGQKRWGTQWLPQADAEQKIAAWTMVATQVNEISGQIDVLRGQLEQVGDASGPEAQAIKDKLTDTQTSLDKLMGSADQPPVPQSIDLIDPFPQSSTLSNSGHPGDATATPTTDTSPDSSTTAPSDSGTASSSTNPDDGSGDDSWPHNAAAFAVGPNLLVTSAKAVENADQIQIQDQFGSPYKAQFVRADKKLGLALIRVEKAKFDYLNLADDFVGGALNCVSFLGTDLFQPTAETIAGKSVASTGAWQVSLDKSPHQPGGPLVVDGKVVGVELADAKTPAGSVPAVSLADLKQFMGSDVSAEGHVHDPVAATFELTASK